MVWDGVSPHPPDRYAAYGHVDINNAVQRPIVDDRVQALEAAAKLCEEHGQPEIAGKIRALK